MPRPTVFARFTAEDLQRITQRSSWPHALLARLLKCNRRTLYRHFPGGGPIPSTKIIAAVKGVGSGKGR